MGFKPLTLNTPPEEEAHVLAEDDAAIFQSIFGKDGVFETGDRMKATVINNNQVRVSNGVICVGGHIGRTEYGDYSDMIIENGEISKNRNDIIMAVFSTTGKTGIDEFKIEVKKGTPGIAAEDPEIVKGDLYEGSKIREFPLWRVKLEGINIVGVEKMFNAIPTIPELEEKIELLNGKIFSSDFIIAQTITLNRVTLKGGTSTSFSEDLESKIPEGYIGIGGFLCSTNSETTVWSTYTYHHSDTGHFYIYASVRNWSSKDISSSPKALCFFVKK
ncbi:MAG: hypothetical protein U0N87_00780 [Anaerobutyricum sp.]